MISVTLATARDFRAYYKHPMPEVCTALVGRENGRILGIGGCMWDDEGRAWGFLDHGYTPDDPPPALTLHRQARRFLAAMRQVGEPAIYTAVEAHRSHRAEAWLRRLGFEISTEFPTADKVVWKWQSQERK